MKYRNAQEILPDALVKELQTYIQGGYLYVPVEEKQQKRWGEVSGYRQQLEQRNRQIRQEDKNAGSVEDLSDRYCLSPSDIRKIMDRK